MKVVKTKSAIYNYLIEPSHLFLKQVVDIAETKKYILVMDTRHQKKRAIPDAVLRKFETRLEQVRQQSCKSEDYDGVAYFLIPKF